MSDVTQILHEIEDGDPKAAEKLLPLVYTELRKLASYRLAQEKPGQTLQSTALVHEAYLRLVGSNNRLQWDSRGHFFSAAAEAMRRILIDQARSKASQRAGGGMNRVALSAVADVQQKKDSDQYLLALDEALHKLEAISPRKANLVKLRYFTGLTIAQAAEALGVATSTAEADWAYAKGWLKLEIRNSD